MQYLSIRRALQLIAVCVALLLGLFDNATTVESPGSGVLIGIIDTGIDWTHLDFRSDLDGDGFEEASRIVGVWDQTGFFNPFLDATAPTGFHYGLEYSKELIESSFVSERIQRPNSRAGRSNDRVGHGTWVAGIAGGDGSSSNLELSGVAPFSEFIVVRTLTFEVNSDNERFMFDAITYMVQKAKALNRKLVINMSLSSFFSSRDGKDPLSMRIDKLIEDENVAIVVSAGNSGALPTHRSLSLGEGDTDAARLIVQERTTILQSIWWLSNPEAEFTIKIVDPNGQIQADFDSTRDLMVENLSHIGIASASSFGPIVGIDDPKFGKGFYIEMLANSGWIDPGKWEIRLTATAGTSEYDGWIRSNGIQSAVFESGSVRKTLTAPATSQRVITVGAYDDGIRWRSITGQQVNWPFSRRGDLAPFSSCGPTVDGRIKPDIVAPGILVPGALAEDSAYSKNRILVLEDNVHTINNGTSAAAPIVSGTIALLWQQYPDLTPEMIKEILNQSATSDIFTSHTPNACWGYGKLNKEEALKSVLKFSLNGGSIGLAGERE